MTAADEREGNAAEYGKHCDDPVGRRIQIVRNIEHGDDAAQHRDKGDHKIGDRVENTRSVKHCENVSGSLKLPGLELSYKKIEQHRSA